MISGLSLALCSFVVLGSAAAAQCPEWSDAFTPGGLNGDVAALQLHDWGAGPELYAGGAFDHAGGESTGSVARWSGLRWESLGPQLGGSVAAFAVYDAGNGPKLYAGGTALLGTTCLAAWDGATWSPVPGFAGGTIRALAVFQGSLYVGGGGWDANVGIGRWDGVGYHGIGGVLGGVVRALAVHDDGQGPALYVGGDFEWAGGTVTSRIARWSGTSWSAVGSHPMHGFYDLHVHDFGSGPELVAAGGGGGVLVMRWNGTSWVSLPGMSTFGSGGLARTLHTAGTGPGAQLYVGCSGSILIGGSAGSVARWVGASWAPVGPGFAPADVYALAHHDAGQGARLYAGGRIRLVGTTVFDNVAQWDGNAWTPTTPSHAIGLSGSGGVRAMARFDDGGGEQLYVAGMIESAGGAATGSLARWDGTTWSSIGEFDAEVWTLCVHDDGGGPQLYAAGGFTHVGGIPVPWIARWNGSTWSPVPGMPLAPVGGTLVGILSHDDGSGSALYAVGTSTIPGAGRALAMRWKDGQWSNVGATVPDCHEQPMLASLAVHAEDGVPRLYGCGYDLPGDCSFRTGVVCWDGTTWSNVGGPLLSTSYLAVSALTSHDDGTGPALYVGGSFSSAGGVPAANIARWRDGAWSGVGGGTDASVFDLASFDEGDGLGPKLVAGGNFLHAGGVLAARLARWHQGAWSELGGGLHPGSGSLASSNALFVDAGPSRSLYVGGNFARAGQQISGNFGRLKACDETGRTYCYGDGSATPCPCGNASAVGERAGCLHSLGTGGTLRARGEPSLAHDSLRIEGASMTNSSALYFQGMNTTSGGQGVPFGDGLKCTSGPFVRLLTKVNVGGSSSFPEVGDPSVSVKGLIGAPGTRHYQVRYRNAAEFCSSETFNYTNAIEVVWRP